MIEESDRGDRQTDPRCDESIVTARVGFEQATVRLHQHTTLPDPVSGINSTLR